MKQQICNLEEGNFKYYSHILEVIAQVYFKNGDSLAFGKLYRCTLDALDFPITLQCYRPALFLHLPCLRTPSKQNLLHRLEAGGLSPPLSVQNIH